MYYSLNVFHLSSRNLPGQEISPRKYTLMRRTGISGKEILAHTQISVFIRMKSTLLLLTKAT